MKSLDKQMLELSKEIALLSSHEFGGSWWGNDTDLEIDLVAEIYVKIMCVVDKHLYRFDLK